MREKTIAIASDHAGFSMKEELKAVLLEKDWKVLDLGTDSSDKSVDYPDFAAKLASSFQKGETERGILICGSGIGISIAANRFSYLRAALVQDVTGARLARRHNDANVLCLGARMLGSDVAKDCLEAFLTTEFEGGRHQNRVEKMTHLGE